MGGFESSGLGSCSVNAKALMMWNLTSNCGCVTVGEPCVVHLCWSWRHMRFPNFCSRVGWWEASLPRMWQSIYIYTILGCKKPCRCHHGQICCVCAQKPHRDCCTHHYKQQVEGKSWCWMHITDTLPSFSRSCSFNQLRISSFGSWLRIRATASWGPGTFKKRCKHNLNAGCATFAPGLWRTTVILAILVHHWN